MSTYPKPEDEIVAETVAMLDVNQRESFEEISGILEYSAGFSRGHAECRALLEVIRRYFTLTNRG